MIVFSLGMEKELTHKLLSLIGERLKHAEIDLECEGSNKRQMLLRALDLAVKDAKEKAEVIAKACGCSLGAVKEIKNESHARLILDKGISDRYLPETSDTPQGISPEEIALTHSIEVTWYLE